MRTTLRRNSFSRDQKLRCARSRRRGGPRHGEHLWALCNKEDSIDDYYYNSIFCVFPYTQHAEEEEEEERDEKNT